MEETLEEQKRLPIWKIIGLVLLLGLLIGGYFGYDYYQKIYGPNTKFSGEKMELFIPSGAEYLDVVDSLKQRKILKSIGAFTWVAQKKNLPKHIYPGKYEIKSGMSNNSLVNMLRSGKDKPVNVVFNYARTKEDLAGKVAPFIEADSAELANLFNDPNFIHDVGFEKETIIAMFIPNTYQFKWSTSAEGFGQRMKKEYNKFWTTKRKEQAKAIGLSPTEVATLASIVQSETNMKKERPTVAGVYMNRLRIGMTLDADPTLIFAMGDFTIKRVLDKHKEIDSPYNTYKNAGLPPGPISLPQIPYLDAVLNYEKHDYLYFCAKEDFSGYSNFAKTYNQHLVNARRYHNAMNKRKIFK